MSPSECYDRIRFSLTDESGVLCFERFEIANTPECGEVEQKLQAQLIGRPLADIDLEYLRGLQCDGDSACMRAVLGVIEEHQHLFLGARDDK